MSCFGIDIGLYISFYSIAYIGLLFFEVMGDGLVLGMKCTPGDVASVRLVGRNLFVSPVYQKGRNLDEKDNFMAWLGDNSLGPFMHFGSDHGRKEYLFQGIEGALCQIANEVFEEEGARSTSFGGDFKGPYRRVVLVRRMPFNREVPVELASKLEERGYVIGNEREHGRILRMVRERDTFACEL